MREFHLQIATPDGVKFDGSAESLLIKCSEGDVEILAGHADLISALGIGRARVKAGDKLPPQAFKLVFVCGYAEKRHFLNTYLSCSSGYAEAHG